MDRSRFALSISQTVNAAAGCRKRQKFQHGQGAIEFLLAAAPVLLLGLGSIEAIHWYFVRQAVSLALMQGARAAITQHADPAVLDAAFTEALLPLHAGPSHAASQARLGKAIERREHATGLPAWRIRILSPSPASFADFASSSPDLSGAGRPIIDNDYLQEQHQARLAQGWPQGRGPLSRQTTLEANTLVLHLTWLHEPLLPGMKQLLRQLAPTDARYGSHAMSIAGYLPLHRQVALVMQSHPIEWEMPAHGRIVRTDGPMVSHPAEWDGGTGPPAPPLSQDDRQARACAGLWCLDVFRSESPQSQEEAAGSRPGDSATGGHPITEPGLDSGPGPRSGSDNGYRDAEPDADPPAAPEDCPGCCD